MKKNGRSVRKWKSRMARKRKQAPTANTTNLENDVKTAEQNMYIW